MKFFLSWQSFHYFNLLWKKFLKGKYFDEFRFGFVWAWRGVFYRFKMRRFGIRFPISQVTRLSNGKNLEFDVGLLDIFQWPGWFFQNYEVKIAIGKDVHIGANVGGITQNHNPANSDEHLSTKEVLIGENCLIWMNAVIIPKVKLDPIPQ